MPFRLLLVLVLLLTAAGLGYVALQAVRPPPAPVRVVAPPPPPVTLRRLVAARPLPAGTLLKDEDLAVRELPPTAATEAALPASDEARAELRGALLRRFLDPNEPVPREAVLRPRDRGFLAAVLRPGLRAIAVGVDAVTGAAGLIWPGDQVDLLLTQELDANATPLARRVAGETVLTDLRVIAVDQQITQGAGGGEAGARAVARTVTLEVTAEQAERVAVAQRLGRLALTVRAMEASAATPGEALFGGDVSRALLSTLPGAGSRMRLIQGGEEQEVTFR